MQDEKGPAVADCGSDSNVGSAQHLGYRSNHQSANFRASAIAAGARLGCAAVGHSNDLNDRGNHSFKPCCEAGLFLSSVPGLPRAMQLLLFPPPSCAILMVLSRFSHLVLPSPKNQASAAMCVQPNALVGKAIQHIVLYCLTPPPFHRYSCLNLCPAYPAQVGTCYGIEPMRHLSKGGGIRLVNRPASSPTGSQTVTTGYCFSQGVTVA